MTWQKLQLYRWIAYAIGLLLLVFAASARNLPFVGIMVVLVFIGDISIVARWNSDVAAAGNMPSLWRRIVVQLVLIGVGVVLAVVGLTVSWGANGFALFGVGIVFFGIGQVVAEIRELTTFAPLRGAVLFGTAVLLIVTGGLLLHLQVLGLGEALVVAAVFSNQLALATATRDVRRRIPAEVVSRGIRGRVWWLLAVAGVALCGLGAFGFFLAGASPSYLLVGLAVVGALVAAVGARANTDVILFVVFFAVLLARAPTDASTPAVMSLHDGQHVIVAMGDSYMSGEGAAHFLPDTNDEDGNACRRSDTAWTVGLTEHPGLNHVVSGASSSGEGLVFVACSGAKATNVLTDGRAQYPHEPVGASTGETQLVQVAHEVSTLHLQVDAVFLSIGGNDAQFSTVGKTCLGPGTCTALASGWFNQLKADVWPQLNAVYAQVRGALPNVPVVVVPYPIPISNTVSGKPCSGSPFSANEQHFLYEYTKTIDSFEQQAAKRAGVLFMDAMQSAFADGSWICGSASQKAVNLFNITQVNGLPDQVANPTRWVHGSFHPNAYGHSKMLAAATLWLHEHGALHNPPPQPSTQPPFVPPLATLTGSTAYGACDSTSTSNSYTRGASDCGTGSWPFLAGAAGTLILRGFAGLALTIIGTWLLFLVISWQLTNVARTMPTTGPLEP